MIIAEKIDNLTKFVTICSEAKQYIPAAKPSTANQGSPLKAFLSNVRRSLTNTTKQVKGKGYTPARTKVYFWYNIKKNN